MTKLNLYSKEQVDALNIGKETDATSATGSLWARIKNAISRIGTLETADGQNVKLTGNQSVSGTKTFANSPVVPTTPDTPTSAVNSVYVNDASEGVNNIVHKTGSETITGSKIYTGQVDLESGLISRNMSIPTNATVPDAIQSKNFIFEAADYGQLGLLANVTATNGNRVMRVRTVGVDGGNSDIDVTRTSAGVVYATAPYRTTGYSDNDIVTIGQLRNLGLIP